jgi:hypothetical protein
MAVDWTQLPRELLQSISKKLTLYSDYVRFRAVCPQWRSSVQRFPRHLPPQFPWLMLPLSKSQLQSHRSFYDVSTNKTHHLELPEACHSQVRVDSSNGWLVIIDSSSAILLLNPLTLAKFNLPPLSSFPNVVSLNFSKVSKEYEYTIREASGKIYRLKLGEMRNFFIKKIVLSSCSVDKDNFIAVAIVNETGELAYCKNGHQYWTSMGYVGLACCDVTYFKEKFYAVDAAGSVVVCDVSGESPSVSVIRMRFSSTIGYVCHKVYLVNSGDELLAVVRQLDHQLPQQGPFMFYLRTVYFVVYRMNWSKQRWSSVEDLGDRVLFVRESSSVSLSAADVQRCSRLSPNECFKNCIYFTDDSRVSSYDGDFGSDRPSCYDMLHRDNDGAFNWDRGIYTLTGGRIISLPCRTRDPHALWFTPTPCSES